VSLSSGFPLHNRYESRLADPAVLKFWLKTNNVNL
jgi:hypothetical protein